MVERPAGSIRRDGSRKPAYDELLKRVKGEWWLSPVEYVTIHDRRITFAGFPGEYEVTIGGERRTIAIDKGMDQVEIRL